MNKSGPIVIIEDSSLDKRLFIEVYKGLKYENELCFFSDGLEALDYLNSTINIPFLILSDINMPKITGFELRSKIHENKLLALKCVPFLFFSDGANKQTVENAYSLSVQGFFRKPVDFSQLETTLKKIIEYWKECTAPNDYNQ